MTDEPAERRIEGLAPRRRSTDLSILQRRNRPPAEDSAPVVIEERNVSEDSISQRKRVSNGTDESKADAKTGGAKKRNTKPEQEETPSSRFTIYLSSTARDSARAAYRATSHLEGDKSWSDFVEKALLAEARRREKVHNRGSAFEVDRSPLTPGRPLG